MRTTTPSAAPPNRDAALRRSLTAQVARGRSLVTRRREDIYWLVVLLTFALGLATADLLPQKLNFGYWIADASVASLIALVTAGHLAFKLNAVVAFWLAYILTCSLGVSNGDGLSQADNQRLAHGTVAASVIVLAVIALLVGYRTRRQIEESAMSSLPTHASTTRSLRASVRARIARALAAWIATVSGRRDLPDGIDAELGVGCEEIARATQAGRLPRRQLAYRVARVGIPSTVVAGQGPATD